jgi:magnesium-transporting ATPase (P-type)
MGSRISLLRARQKIFAFLLKNRLKDEIVELKPEIKTEIISKINDFAKDGLRVLGFAYRKFEENEPINLTAESAENNLVFIGITAMYDLLVWKLKSNT